MAGDVDGVIVMSRVTLVEVMMVVVVVAMVVIESPVEPHEWPCPSPEDSNFQVPPTEYSNCPNCWTLPPTT